MDSKTRLIHGTCVDLAGVGVIFLGPPGSGKSDLALRLVDGGARLVADDQVVLRVEEGRLLASPPAAIAGLLEVRGVGIVRLGFVNETTVRLLVDLVAPEMVDRLPDPERRELAGVTVPVLSLAAFEASAAAKVRLAAGASTGDIGAQ